MTFCLPCTAAVESDGQLCRWKYLEAGVSKIMVNLQEGIDMQTVSTCAVK